MLCRLRVCERVLKPPGTIYLVFLRRSVVVVAGQGRGNANRLISHLLAMMQDCKEAERYLGDEYCDVISR